MKRMNGHVYLAVKHFQINSFGELLTEIKFWSLPTMWTIMKQVVLIEIQQLVCEKINGFNKMNCFQLKKKKKPSSENLRGFSFNYVIKGPAKKSFVSGLLPEGAL